MMLVIQNQATAEEEPGLRSWLLNLTMLDKYTETYTRLVTIEGWSGPGALHPNCPSARCPNVPLSCVPDLTVNCTIDIHRRFFSGSTVLRLCCLCMLPAQAAKGAGSRKLAHQATSTASVMAQRASVTFRDASDTRPGGPSHMTASCMGSMLTTDMMCICVVTLCRCL